jgi:hypothetical protein
MTENNQTVLTESTHNKPDHQANLAPTDEDSNGDTHQPGHRAAPGTPRWVKVFGVILIGLVVLFAVLHLSGHSPVDHMNHMSPTQQGMQMP